MEFFEVVLKRRSIRRFKSERIPKHMVDRILECAMYAPSARNRRPVHLVVVEDKGTIESLRRLREGAFSFLESSPLAIVVACEGVDTWESDSAIVATFIQLCTVDLGLGSCWGHVANRVEDRVKELLKIPEEFRVLCVIGIGFPNEEKPEHTRDEMDGSRIHREIW